MSETAHWKAAVSGNFAAAADWSTGVVPGNFSPSGESNHDTALLDAAGAPYSVIYNSSHGTLANISIAANATLYVIGSKGMATNLESNIDENNGKIVVGVAKGGSGATLYLYAIRKAEVNKGLIVVKADGALGGPIDNEGTIDVVGGVFSDFASSGSGKWRIDGGTLQWTWTKHGAVSFYGAGGGDFDLFGSAAGKMATICGFSNTGDTSVVVENWTRGTGHIRVEQTARATELVLAKDYWLRFAGDFIGDTFSISGTTITCHKSSGASTSAVLGNFTQAVAAGFDAPAPLAASHSLAPAQNNNLTIPGHQGSSAPSDASSRAVLARFIQFVAAASATRRPWPPHTAWPRPRANRC